MVPEACCQHASQNGEMGLEQCLSGNMMYRNNKVTSDIDTVILSPLFKTMSVPNWSQRQLRGNVEELAESCMAFPYIGWQTILLCGIQCAVTSVSTHMSIVGMQPCLIKLRPYAAKL